MAQTDRVVLCQMKLSLFQDQIQDRIGEIGGDAGHDDADAHILAFCQRVGLPHIEILQRALLLIGEYHAESSLIRKAVDIGVLCRKVRLLEHLQIGLDCLMFLDCQQRVQIPGRCI